MKIILSWVTGILLLNFSALAQEATVQITGTLKGAKDSVILFKRNGTDVLTGERDGTRYKAIINSTGAFTVSLPVTAIDEWVIEVDETYKIVHLSPGRNLKLVIDKGNNYEIKAVGEFADDFNFLKYSFALVDSKFNYSEIQKLPPLEALKKRKERAEFQKTILKDYQQTHQMSQDYVKWLTINYTYEPYERTFVEHSLGSNTPDSAIMSAIMELGINDDDAARYSNPYHILVNHDMHFKFNGYKFPYKLIDIADYSAKNLKGFTKQVYLTRKMIQLSKSNDSVYRVISNRLLKEISDKQLVNLITSAREKYISSLNESNRSKEIINESASLNEIFSKYKGKTIYVDFWASWCGPCKSEMPNSNRLKAKLKGKNVVFVYLGYRDVKENWLAARKELEIEGEHYLLSNKLIIEANEIFKISGIPHYAIIDKNGVIVDKNALRPRNVFDQLLKLSANK